MRVGQGYDVHRLSENRDLILGGVKIPFKLGLLGHSDADVLVHAIIDSILGAAAIGDIGKLFPDTDKTYKDANSLNLLKIVCQKAYNRGYSIENIDSTIVAQELKLASFIPQMVKNIAKTCCIPMENVSVKATTEEHLGFTGNCLGIKAYAVCLINDDKFKILQK